MHSLAKKPLFKWVAGLAILGLPSAALFFAALADRRPIAFESEESLTNNGGAIFNRVTYQTEPEGDVWMMQQSHEGLPANDEQWSRVDRIAIRVQSHKSDGSTATFLQLAPGKFRDADGKPDLKEITGFRVPCGICHSNGPRVMRPKISSITAPLSTWDRWRVFVWNIKIKSSGRVNTIRSPSEDLGRVPFRFRSHEANAPITITVCTICHRDRGPLARGVLTRQNYLSIRFMVKRGYMPPLGLPLTDATRQQLLEFMNP